MLPFSRAAEAAAAALVCTPVSAQPAGFGFFVFLHLQQFDMLKHNI